MLSGSRCPQRTDEMMVTMASLPPAVGRMLPPGSPHFTARPAWLRAESTTGNGEFVAASLGMSVHDLGSAPASKKPWVVNWGVQ